MQHLISYIRAHRQVGIGVAVLVVTGFLYYISALLFIVVLLLLVVIHEFGHFIAAKWTGMRVDEFAFGFPPRVWSIQKGETTYAFNALPLGGYVSIWGENGDKDDIAKTHPRAFNNRPVWAKLITISAGVIMNVLLACVLFIITSYGDIRVSTDDVTFRSRAENVHLVVMDAHPESPAYKAGLVPGSTITSLTSRGSSSALTSATSAIVFIQRNIDAPITFGYTSVSGAQEETTITGVYGIIPDKKALGVSLDTIGTVTTTLPEAITLGVYKTYDITVATLGGLADIVTSLGKGENVLEALSGPVGIARIVHDRSEYGVAAVLTLVAVLSINLAVLNALPLPALDGGRFIIILGEAVVRKRVPHKALVILNSIGFILLLGLVLVVTFKDIFALFA